MRAEETLHASIASRPGLFVALRALLFAPVVAFAGVLHSHFVGRAQAVVFLAQSFESVAELVALSAREPGASSSIAYLQARAELDLVLANEAWRERRRLLRRARRLLAASDVARGVIRLAVWLSGLGTTREVNRG
jgi:hypothetical protein